KKTSPFGEEKSALPSRQCTGSHVPAPMAKFNEFRYKLLLYPAFARFNSLRLFLFPNLKKWFGGKRFTTREQLIAETETYFEELDKSYYSDGLKKLENRWIKCIELKGDYVEK
ncbi:SETMR methyltransferase, partial [Acromyrmex charruanus]